MVLLTKEIPIIFCHISTPNEISSVHDFLLSLNFPTLFLHVFSGQPPTPEKYNLPFDCCEVRDKPHLHARDGGEATNIEAVSNQLLELISQKRNRIILAN